MPATFQTDGAINVAQGGNDTGAACTLIGCAANQSGVTVRGNFTDSVADQLAWHIGGGDNTVTPGTSNSASNTGQVIQTPVAFAAGAGYVPGTYRVASNASGGQPAGAGEIEIVVGVGGAITSARVVRAGSGFTGAPTFTVANAVNVDGKGVPIGGGGGTLTVTAGLLSQVYALGAAYGASKNTQRLTATAPVAIGAAIAPSAYLNRSGRAMVAGESAWGVEP